MATRAKVKATGQDRLTISLAPGQREALEAIAEHNSATLAFVMRYALKEFIENRHEQHLQLRFPKADEPRPQGCRPHADETGDH